MHSGEGSFSLMAACALVGLFVFGCFFSDAQAQGTCGTDGYRTVARSWDAVLKREWESRQECAHPERPLRLVAINYEDSGSAKQSYRSGYESVPAATHMLVEPLLVKAGDTVRLWMQGTVVRIEMSGVAERSASQGERVIVQVTRHDDDAGLTVEHIAGTVSGAGEVEMER